ncbi:MAG: type II secretion system protein GspD [Gemmatimonadaceae bacterium]|nr:type II secretion system protein GspD [Gemmatimonadaceae bacterium]
MTPTRRILPAATALIAAMAVSAHAQGGTQGGRRGAPPSAGGPVTVQGRGAPAAVQGRGAPQRADSQSAYALDFQNQELQVVLNALSEAGNLNVTMTNVPSQRVTVRMARGVPRDSIASIVKALAEANGMKFIVQGPLIRIEGDPSLTAARQQATQQQQLQQQAQAAQLKLFTVRLKHAAATAVAPVLMNLLGNATGGVGGVGGGVTVLPGGGIQITQPAAGGRGGAATTTIGGLTGGAPTGGRGEAAVVTGTAIAGGGANTGAAQQGGGGVTAFGGRAGRGGAQGALATALQGLTQGLTQQLAPGALSSSTAQIRIVAEESTNSLLIRATDADFQLLQGIIQTVDLRPLQVLIEVTIAEVQRSNDLNVGVGGTATRKGATANAPRDTVGLLPGNQSARDFIFALTGGGGSINYNAAINALQTRGDVKVLSLPVIIAQNNKQASLNVGERRPFVQVNQSVTTGTIPTTVQTVQYIDVGTALTITPTINPDGYVNMAVSQTNDAATTELQFNAPVISKREAVTQIFLRDGQTTVIGGLAGNTTSKTTSGLPWLSRIPILGSLLFGNTKQTQTTNELFLFLTPHIISSDADIEKFRNSLKSGTDLLKDVPLGPRIAPGDSINVRVPPDTGRRRPPQDR